MNDGATIRVNAPQASAKALHTDGVDGMPLVCAYLALDQDHPCMQTACEIVLGPRYDERAAYCFYHNKTERFVTPGDMPNPQETGAEITEWLRSPHLQPEQPKSRDYLRAYEY